MQGHFDQHLNLRKLILDRYPKMIVECGAGNGDLTRLIAHLKWHYEFEFHVISDKEVEGLDPDINWKTGISYQELTAFDDKSIDLCIIDTDHNYWTLRKELEALTPKMKEGGLIVMHDVEEFYHDTGMAMSYWNDTPYPEKEIKDCAKQGGLGLALIDFLHEYRGDFKLVRYLPEHFGVAVIERKTIKVTRMILPGENPVFAKPNTTIKQEEPCCSD